MFRRKEMPYPKESYGADEYYVIGSGSLKELDGVNVKFSGTVDAKPVIEYYKTSWPWDLGSRMIEEDHGHRTTLSVDGVTVYLTGVAPTKVGERVTVWGRWNGRSIEARRLETPGLDFRS
jgi:hypothetical protein